MDGTVPLLGPLADGGLKFRYYDVFGNETSVLADIHRIDVLVRGDEPRDRIRGAA